MKLKDIFIKDILNKIFLYDQTKYENFQSVINEINSFQLWNTFSDSCDQERNLDLCSYWMNDKYLSDFVSDKDNYSHIFKYIKEGPKRKKGIFGIINN